MSDPCPPCVLSTGRLARLVGLSRCHVARVCRRENVGFRVGIDRRIKLAEALEFAREHEYPLDALEELARREGVMPLLPPLLLLASPQAGHWLASFGGIFRVVPVLTSFEARGCLDDTHYRAVIVDTALGSAPEILRFALANRKLMHVTILAGEDRDTCQNWISEGAHYARQKPFNLPQLANELHARLAAWRSPRSSESPAPRLRVVG